MFQSRKLTSPIPCPIPSAQVPYSPVPKPILLVLPLEFLWFMEISVHSLQEERAVGFSGRDIKQNHQRSICVLPSRAPSVNGPFKVHVWRKGILGVEPPKLQWGPFSPHHEKGGIISSAILLSTLSHVCPSHLSTFPECLLRPCPAGCQLFREVQESPSLQMFSSQAREHVPFLYPG